MCLAARTVADTVICQLPDVIALAVDISPNQVFPAVVIQEILPVLRGGMLRIADIQCIHITEFPVNVVRHADHLPVILHGDEKGKVDYNLAIDQGRARGPVVYPGLRPGLHRILFPIAIRVVRRRAGKHVAIEFPFAKVAAAVNADRKSGGKTIEPITNLDHGRVGTVEIRNRVQDQIVVLHRFTGCQEVRLRI